MMSIATTAALLETSGWAAMLLHQLCICLSAWDGCCGELPGDISDRHCLKNIALCTECIDVAVLPTQGGHQSP